MRPLILLVLLIGALVASTEAGKYVYVPVPTDAWTVCDTAHRCTHAEDWVYDADVWEAVADGTADGGFYLHPKSGTREFQAQIGTELDTTCDYLWVRAKGTGVIWLQKTVYGQVPSNTTANILFNGTTAADWTWTPIGNRSDENLRRINAGSSVPINDVAQRDFNLVTTERIFLYAQSSVQLDSFFCSTDPNAIPVSPSGGGGGTVNYSLYEVTTEPTVDDTQWDRASIVAKTGYTNTTPAADMIIKGVWKNGTPDRICLHGEETLANLTWSSTTEDGAVTAETRLQALFKGDNLNRVKDANLWSLQVNPQPAKTDANFPAGVYTLATDLTTVNATASLSGNRRRMQVCFNSPFPIATNTQWLCDFAQWEKVTSVTVRRQSAFTTLSDITDPTGFGICAAGGPLPGVSDSTPPVVGPASVSNVTGSSLTVTATASDGESGISSCNVVYKTPATGTPTFGTDPSVMGTMAGGSCSATVSGLVAGTAYRSAVYAVNGAGLSTTGASVDQTTTAASLFYVSTGGSGSTCSTGSPCALSRLLSTSEPRPSPGETWILKNGTYTITTANPVHLNCATSGGNALNGTAAARITLQAETERQAWLKGDGQIPPLRFTSCTYWDVRGIRISGRDNNVTNADGTLLDVAKSHNMRFFRNLFHHSNRWTNQGLILNGGVSTESSNNNLYEENELYYFHRHGLLTKYSTGTIFRRNYCNSRNYMDIPASTSDSFPNYEGDQCVFGYPSTNLIAENNIAENAGGSTGLEALAGHDAVNNKFLGNIVNNGQYGAVVRGRTDGVAIDTLYRNHLVIDTSAVGVYFRGNRNSRCEQCTVMGTSQGLVVDQVSSFPPTPPRSAYFENTLVVTSTNRAYAVATADVEDWGMNYPAALATTGTTFSPSSADSHITNEVISSSNQMGSCRVYIPSSAGLLKSAGAGNEDIGATILFAYVNGTLTNTKLWQVGHVSSGKWLGGLGATVSGTNPPFSATLQVTNADLNTVTDGATDVHSRLNITALGCLPVGY